LSALDYLGRILETYSNGDYFEEAKRARVEFIKKRGVIDTESDDIERHLDAFADWFIFDRSLSKNSLKPVRYFLDQYYKDLTYEDQEVYEKFFEHVPSVFVVKKIKDKDLFVQDLYDKKKYTLSECDQYRSLEKGTLIQARIIPFKGRLVFGLSFIFHPPETKNFITKRMKSAKKEGAPSKENLLDEFALMKLRTEQYSHIDFKDIYSEEPLL